MTSQLIGIDLDQYRTQAKNLLSQAQAASPDAIERIRLHHPEQSAVLSSQNFKLADAQLIIARENGWPSWPKFKEYVLFRNAVKAIDTGDIQALDTLLSKHPALVDYRCTIGEWYESGYFSGAGLLQHIAGNPIRCPLPSNIVEITQVLLRHGADPNTNPTTISLLFTSKQASEAGVAVELIDILQHAGATHPVDLENPAVLDDPIWHAGIETARELVKRGAKMDLPQAAGLGRLDVMQKILDERELSPDLLEISLIYASVQNQEEAARFLVKHGAKGDVIPSVNLRGGGQATALHNAAYRGYAGIVQVLLNNGADRTVRDLQYSGTSADWARHGGHEKLAELLKG